MAPTHPGHWPRKLICSLLAACFAQGSSAMPTAPNVVNGSATFSQNGNALTVTNSNGTIINWRTFSTGSHETIRFVQPSASSSVMNRVLGADPSVLQGLLQSNGRVFLINPAGITVGAGARIDVAGFVASTLSLSDADFLANRLSFVGTGTAGALKVEQGAEIRSASGGQVYLVAPQVENHGLITTPQGEVILAAGQQVELFDSGTPGVRVAVTNGGQATNLGQLMVESGRVGMVGAVVRQHGTASASSIVREGGRIFLRATESAELAAASQTRADGSGGGTIDVDGGGLTTVAGSVTATGTADTGGRVALLGDKVGILPGATVDVSGARGGGTLLAGGDFQGSNPEVRNAQISYLADGATLRADATASGNGGKIIVWADDTTRAYGTISAQGGAAGGDGGFVEVSGKRSLDFDAQVSTLAPQGKTGTLLLDPNAVTITNGGPTPIGGASWTESGGGSTLSWASIDTQLQTTDVTITTSDSGGAGDDINFMPGTPTAITASPTATHKLTLIADDNISFSTGITLKGALQATALNGNIMFSDSVTTQGNFTASAAGYIDLMRYKAISYGDMSFTAGTNITVLPAGGFGDAGLFMHKAGGSQTLTAGGSITLVGGYNPTPNGAYIYSAGSQSITATGSLSLTGGTGSGDNRAEIRALGSQTINAGSISLSADTSSTNGSAKIYATGNQTIQTNSGAITLTGAANSLNNEATIESDTYQYVDIAGNLVISGGGNGSSPAGGAMLTAPSQHIIVNGNLTMTAGNSSTTGAYGMGAPAVIGWDSGADVFLDVAGSLSLNGTNATNQSVIGAAVGAATVEIEANAITTTANTLLGNWDGSMGGSIELTATSGAISLPANSSLRTGSLAANAGSSISMIGNNFANYVDLIGGSSVAYATSNTGTTHIEAIDAGGAITVTGNAGSTSIALGSLNAAGAANIVVTAQGQILDDNGSGVANLTSGSGNIALTSQVGTPVAGTLAISTDVATSGQVTANVNGGPYGSISIRDVGANAVNQAGINASAATSEGNVEYFRYGNLDIGGTTTLMLTPKASAGTSIGASGDVQLSASLSMTGAKDALSAGGNLTVAGGTLTMSGNGLLVAGGNLSLTGGNVSMQGLDNTVVAGGTLNIAAGRTLTAGMGPLDVYAGSLALSGTLSSYGDLTVTTPGNLDITNGNLTSTFGNVDFVVGGQANVIGNIGAARGIIGDALGGLTLGAAAGGSGSINAADGIVDLLVGGTGIEMYNGSSIGSTDPTQPAGGLITLFFPGLGAGGSMIDGVATFEGGYKVAGNFTTLGTGLEVTYGILSNPVSDAIIAAINTSTSSAGGTAQTSDSLALITTTAGTGGPMLAGDGTQTIGGTSDSFGGEGNATTSQDGRSSGNGQDGKNAKKKPGQCSA